MLSGLSLPALALLAIAGVILDMLLGKPAAGIRWWDLGGLLAAWNGSSILSRRRALA